MVVEPAPRERGFETRMSMRDPTVHTPSSPNRPYAAATPTKPKKLEPHEFARWVDVRAEGLAERWLADVRARHTHWNQGIQTLLGRFFSVFTSMLGTSLGPYREQVEPLWLQAAELFGSVAAQRGLAVGEAVEEFQILREVVIRALYADPPAEGKSPIPLRDLLRLNRVIDRGVTQVSVGHADVLFFALFQGTGAPEHIDDPLIAEMTSQLRSIDAEFRAVMRSQKR